MSFVKNIWNKISKDHNMLGRILLIIMVIAILFAAFALSGPKPDDELALFPAETAVRPKITSSAESSARPPSPEYVQTTGVIVAVMTIVLIVIIGTLIDLERQKKAGSQ